MHLCPVFAAFLVSYTTLVWRIHARFSRTECIRVSLGLFFFCFLHHPVWRIRARLFRVRDGIWLPVLTLPLYVHNAHRHLTAEIAQAYNDKDEEEGEGKPTKVPTEKLYELAEEIVPYCMRHNGVCSVGCCVKRCYFVCGRGFCVALAVCERFNEVKGEGVPNMCRLRSCTSWRRRLCPTA